MLTKAVSSLPSKPLGRIVHGLSFLCDYVFSIFNQVYIYFFRLHLQIRFRSLICFELEGTTEIIKSQPNNQCKVIVSAHSLERYGEGEIKLLKKEYLCLSPSVIMKQFEPVLEAMKDHLDVLLSKTEFSKVKVMLLVGGFAESPILQQEIMKKFNGRCRVIVPRDAAKAVIQGAVMFGKLPGKISQSVVATTYGCDCSRDFVEGVHPKEKKFIADDIEKCRDLFACFVQENETVKLGQRIRQVSSCIC